MIPIDNKSFYLTYSQCKITLEGLLNGIKKAFHEHMERKVVKYVVCHELHMDGNPHRHCFIDLNSSFRGKVSARFLDIDGHHPEIQFCRSNKAVLKYCLKEGDYITNMDLTKKVTKEDIAKKILSGTRLVDIVQEAPRYLFGYSRLKQDLQLYQLDSKELETLDGTCGLWLFGEAGTGKSTIARRIGTAMGGFFVQGAHKWFDGYNGEPVVICDDVDISWKETLPLLKIWADKYPFQGQTKGGFVGLRPKRLIVTSNKTLDELLELCRWDTSDYEPYRRRFEQKRITSIDEWEDDL